MGNSEPTKPLIFRLGDEANRVLVAANPKAGSGERWRLVESLLDQCERLHLKAQLFTNLDDVTAAAQKLHADGQLRALVSAGGDGTLAELVNRTQPGLPLAVFPLGTENLLARHLQLHADPYEIASLIKQGWAVQLDAGRANGRVFVLMSSFGFDADVVERLHSARSGNIQHLSYIKPIWESIRSYDYPDVQATCRTADGDDEKFLACWGFVFNLPCYAGGLQFCPQAVATDGRLDLCTFRGGSLTDGLWYLGNLLMGRHQQLDDCQMGQYTRIRLESAARVAYQLDGDPGGHLPLEIEVESRRWTLVVPPRWLHRSGVPLSGSAQV